MPPGNKSWEATFGGAYNDSNSSVQQTADGGYIMCGDTMSYGAGSNDAQLIKIASDVKPLSVTSIAPRSGVRGWPVSITNLAGAGFQSGAAVRIEQSSGSTVIHATNVKVVSDSKITSNMSLQGARLGKYDVVVTNPDST